MRGFFQGLSMLMIAICVISWAAWFITWFIAPIFWWAILWDAPAPDWWERDFGTRWMYTNISMGIVTFVVFSLTSLAGDEEGGNQ